MEKWNMGKGAHAAPLVIAEAFVAAWAKNGVPLKVEPYAGAFGVFQNGDIPERYSLACDDDGAIFIPRGDVWMEGA